MLSVHRKNHRENNGKIADVLHIRNNKCLNVGRNIVLNVRREDIMHQHLENIELKFIVMRQIRQQRKQEQDKRKQTQKKAPRNTCGAAPNLHFKNTLTVYLEHFPKRNS